MVSVSFVWSHANLLSGGLDDCQHPDDETCEAGVATVNAFLRHYSAGQDIASLVINRIDYQSPFVQMHPLDWGVNRLVLNHRFGWDVFFAYTSMVTQSKDDSSVSKRDLSILQTSDFRPLLGNTVVATSNSWAEYTKNIHFDEATGLAIFAIVDGKNTEDSTSIEGAVKGVSQVAAAKGLLNYVAKENESRPGCSDTTSKYDLYLLQRNQTNVDELQGTNGRCWIPVIVYEDSVEEYFQKFLKEVLNMENRPPAAIVHARSSTGEFREPKQLGPNGDWVVSVFTSYDVINHLRFHISDNDKRMITNVTFTEQDVSVIPPEIKDDSFREDIQFLKELADEAKSNNPIVGLSKFMPLSDNDVGDIRTCFGGECPIGNLYTDALRWRTGADFAFINSGGIRGPGWPEGEVRMSDIWASLPFANTECTGIISGINLFRLFEFSTSEAEFLSHWTSDGDKLFQVSGIRYTYNTQLDAPRLVALEIWDDKMNKYVPVERLKFYKFATGSWECSGFDPVPSMVGEELTIEGEEPAVIGDVLLQTIVGEYLAQLEEAYDTSVQGRLLNDTSAMIPLQFVQTEDSCNSTTYWVEKFQSCLNCPATRKVELKVEQFDFESETQSELFLESEGRIFNGESFPITVVAKSKPNWLSFTSKTVWRDDEGQKILIAPGDFFSFDFKISSANLEAGIATAPISFAVLDGGNFPGCVGRDASVDISMQVKNESEFLQAGSVLIVGFTLMAIVVMTTLLFAFWVYRNQEKRAVKSMQPIFLIVLSFGVIVISLSIVPVSIHGWDLSDWGQNAACMAVPWLLSMGFSIVMSALIAKLWRINKVFSSGRFRRVQVTSRAAILPFSAVLVINLILMLVWTLVDPMQYEVKYIEGEEWKLYGSCANMDAAGWSFLGLTIGLNFFALLAVCYEAYKARDISDDFSESKSLGFAVFSWIQILLVGVPVLFLIDEDNVNPKYFLQVALIFAGCMSMILIIHIPLVSKLRSSQSVETRRGSTKISGFLLKLSRSSFGEVMSALISKPMAPSPADLSAEAQKVSSDQPAKDSDSDGRKINDDSGATTASQGESLGSFQSKDLIENAGNNGLREHEAKAAIRTQMMAVSEATIDA